VARVAAAGAAPREAFYEWVERDDDGRVKARTERVEGRTTTFRYEYDESGRLAYVYVDGRARSHYEYDLNSNRIGRFVGGRPIAASYEPSDQIKWYEEGARATYGMTPAGETRLRETEGDKAATFSYDDFGNLKSATLPDGSLVEYKLDAGNRRVFRKLASPEGAISQQWRAYHPDGRLAAISDDGSARHITRFIYGSDPRVPDLIVTGSGRTFRLVKDYLGSARLAIDVESGATMQEMEFDEFGRVLRDTNPGFQPFGFAGGLYDPATGLTRFGARDYDPETGRWTTPDPILFAGGGTNFYEYAGSDPVNFVDPTGEIWVQVGAGAIVGAATAYQNYQSASVVRGASNAQVVGSTIVGAIAGFAAGAGGSVNLGWAAPAMAAGAIANNASNQYIFKGAVSDRASLLRAGFLGAGSGFLTGVMGHVLPSITPLNQEGAQLLGLPLNVLGLNVDNGIPSCVP
jgi:RHS repeat-associated protein